MAGRARDNLHSRLVAVLKVVLPLVALALLSSLFLFSRGIDPEDAIPYARVDVEDRLADPRMTGAGFAGTTPEGGAITLQAAEAKPGADGAGGASAQAVKGSLTTPDGVTSEIAALRAAFSADGKTVSLSGGVELRSSAGYVIQSEGFDLGVDRSWAESRGKVSAQAPMGQLEAGGLRLDRAAGGEDYQMVFNGGVRLLYEPEK